MPKFFRKYDFLAITHSARICFAVEIVGISFKSNVLDRVFKQFKHSQVTKRALKGSEAFIGLLVGIFFAFLKRIK